MSLPNIPDMNPQIDVSKEDAVNLLLISIAMEEMGLSHIINAEGEKIQAAIEKCKSKYDLEDINESVNGTLRNLIKKEMLLQFKLEDVADMIDTK